MFASTNSENNKFRVCLSRQSCLGEWGAQLPDNENCYRKVRPSTLIVGGLEVGISGLQDIVDKALERIDDSDQEQRRVLLNELKARNYVPGSVEEEYMIALWPEYKKARTERREKLDASFRGIPREEIPWFPAVNDAKCTGCSSCVEFCIHGVFKFDGKSHVVKPYNCVVGNTTCRSFCPEKAITFPTYAALKTTLAKLREKHGLE